MMTVSATWGGRERFSISSERYKTDPLMKDILCIRHQAAPASERLWKNCLRKAGKLVERAKTMMTRASPDLIYRVSGSPHPSPQLTCWRQTAAGWRAGVVSQRGLT